MERDMDGAALLPIEEVAARIRRSVRSTMSLCQQRQLGYVVGTPIIVREDQLWLYLIETKNVRPEAFGAEPHSEGAASALAAARAKVIADRLAEIEYDDARRARITDAARERASKPRPKVRRR
ncbi:hypothetical protein LB518_10105 [Mesorhizobium sp. BR1-1-16]|uniref:hypothetical protein n=1 Tax=Mesorhizobium sp. BR1-1-16 TaxID=2876653 RepID=UPI001CC9577A|nr:hypothetical protein [Mesorhizobium sp. BR1-1-16]MBZ9936648.1 hypothetical protein [Mesorhizobium sp. BR1-1-16]